jgi:hypothetical protein
MTTAYGKNTEITPVGFNIDGQYHKLRYDWYPDR